MNEHKMSDNLNKSTEENSARSISRRALLIALLALPFAAIVEPEPAAAQLLGIPGAVFRGVFGGDGYHYHHHGGGRRYTHYARTQPTHRRHASATVAHRSHGGGHHYAGSNTSSGPGSGSFH
jgi:hypothetical protein